VAAAAGGKKMERVLIIGAGPLARLIPSAAADLDDLELLGFVDVADESSMLRGDAAQLPVYERARFPAGLIEELGDFSVLVVGSLKGQRPGLIAEAKEAGLSFANIIHPSAIISGSAQLGCGILILPGVIIGPGVVIGNYVVLNSAVTVDHDSVIEDSVTLGPGVHIAGVVTVGRETLVGIGACVLTASIGSNCIIGAGSAVTRNIPDNVVAAGVPAKVIRSRD